MPKLFSFVDFLKCFGNVWAALMILRKYLFDLGNAHPTLGEI